MANLKISQLTLGNPAQSTDEVPINRAGANFKITAGSIAALTPSSPVSSVFGRTGAISAVGTDYAAFYDALGAAAAAQAASISATLMTTKGDLIIENATPAPARLGIGSTGQVLTVVSGLPAWANITETWANLTGDLTITQVIPFDGSTPGTPDTGISRLSPAALAIGNGATGDISGSLTLLFIDLSQTGGTINAQTVTTIGTGVGNGLVIQGSLTDINNSVGAANQSLTSNGSTGVVWSNPTTAWSSLTGATANVTITNTNRTTTFTQTSAIAWLWSNLTVATALSVNASPIHDFRANYWTGSISAVDDWKLNSSLAAGSNATSTFQFVHSGSTGLAIVSVPNLQTTKLYAAAANGDMQGSISSISGTTVSLSFAANYVSTPIVVVTPTTNAGAFYLSSVSNSGFTVTYATSGAQTFNYHVIGNPN